MEKTVRLSCTLTLGAMALLVVPAVAQQPANNPSAPVANAVRGFQVQFARNLVAAADDMPVSKFTFKSTPQQLSVADVVEHLAGSNNFMCSAVGGVPAPNEAKLAGKPDDTSPDTLRARLKRSFTFCETALAKLDDSKLADSVPWFSGKRTRANVMVALPYDWADHYSQMAIYLRLNGISPPNARVRATPVP